MNVKQAHIEREFTVQKKHNPEDKPNGLAILAEKVLNSHEEDFKQMISSYLQCEWKFQDKMREFTVGKKPTNQVHSDN